MIIYGMINYPKYHTLRRSLFIPVISDVPHHNLLTGEISDTQMCDDARRKKKKRMNDDDDGRICKENYFQFLEFLEDSLS